MSPGRGISRREFVTVSGLAGVGIVLPGQEYFPRPLQLILAKSDPIARQFGKYTAYQLSWDEFIGTGEPDTEENEFRHRGYEPNPLAAAKYHPETNDLHDRSWRRIDDDHPRWQWHVHTWEDAEQIEVFSHYEYRPDPWLVGDESHSEMIQRLEDHYNPKKDDSYPDDKANYHLGAACPRIRAYVKR